MIVQSKYGLNLFYRIDPSDYNMLMTLYLVRVVSACFCWSFSEGLILPHILWKVLRRRSASMLWIYIPYTCYSNDFYKFFLLLLDTTEPTCDPFALLAMKTITAFYYITIYIPQHNSRNINKINTSINYITNMRCLVIVSSIKDDKKWINHSNLRIS